MFLIYDMFLIIWYVPNKYVPGIRPRVPELPTSDEKCSNSHSIPWLCYPLQYLLPLPLPHTVKTVLILLFAIPLFLYVRIYYLQLLPLKIVFLKNPPPLILRIYCYKSPPPHFLFWEWGKKKFNYIFCQAKGTTKRSLNPSLGDLEDVPKPLFRGP